MTGTEELLIVETAAQVRWASNNGLFSRTGLGILVITPEAAYECQQLGCNYIKLEDFVQVTHRRNEYDTVLRNFLEWSEWLDTFAHEAVPEFRDIGYFPARCSFYPVQSLHAELWAARTNLAEMLERLKCKHIRFWSQTIESLPPHFLPSVSMIPIVVSDGRQHRGLEVEDLGISLPWLKPVYHWHDPVERISNFRRLKQRIGRLLLLRLIYRSHFRAAYEVLVGRWLHRGPKVLCAGAAAGLNQLVHDMLSLGVKVNFLDISIQIGPGQWPIASHYSMPESHANYLNDLTANPRFRTLTENLEIGHTDVWNKALECWWYGRVPQQLDVFKKAQSLLDKEDHSLIIGWDFSGYTLGATVANAARSSGVPSVVVQHGGSSNNTFSQSVISEFINSDIYLAFGQGTIEAFIETMPAFVRARSRMFPIGSQALRSVSLQNKVSRIRKSKMTFRKNHPTVLVLYIPTHFGGVRTNNWMADYPDISYFEWQQKILGIFVEFPKIRLLYKPFPGEEERAIISFLAKHVPNSEITNHLITDSMWWVDAIVIDHVCTTMGEILLTNKPIVALMPDDGRRATNSARSLLSKRASVAKNIEEFELKVRLLLERAEFDELDEVNNDFLKKYVIGQQSLGSGREIVSFVMKCAQEFKTHAGNFLSESPRSLDMDFHVKERLSNGISNPPKN